ncbi:hypothetical protein HU200_061835 [Digitaria exilis]|uniref:KIB1-4 beta-propeller domain-containing protein n=1 Tax=Digitaria exilis TaxID=1010633 RepID=A0A835DW22_9POAL|nr:hypothetical protein HU200_061835 [Digitaria exilis]
MASPAHQDHACSSTRPRRRRRVVVADGTARDESLWASLPEDLIGLVAWRVLAGDLRDYVRLRWRSGTPSPCGRGVVDARFHPRRWMMLPEGRGLHPGHGKLRGYVRFFNLSTGRDHDTAVRLLHPFTGDILDFPPLETLQPHVHPGLPGDKSTYLRKVGAASISVGADGLVRVMMSLHHIRNVCFATSGDQQWRVSSWLQDVCSVPFPLAFQGKLYSLRPKIHVILVS